MGAKNNEIFLRPRVTMFLDENCDKIPAKFSDKLKKEGWFFFKKKYCWRTCICFSR